MNTDNCPHCGTSLIGEEIPMESVTAGYYGPHATHFRREIGIEVRGVYDGVLFWACPDCGGHWHRFPEGDIRRAYADYHMSIRDNMRRDVP